VDDSSELDDALEGEDDEDDPLELSLTLLELEYPPLLSLLVDDTELTLVALLSLLLELGNNSES